MGGFQKKKKKKIEGKNILSNINGSFLTLYRVNINNKYFQT